VPYAIGLGALTGLLSLLPGGTFATTLAGTIWLVAHGESAAAIGMLLWGVLLVGSLVLAMHRTGPPNSS
jgi:predicted PurR-regulated permease PerM